MAFLVVFLLFFSYLEDVPETNYREARKSWT